MTPIPRMPVCTALLTAAIVRCLATVQDPEPAASAASARLASALHATGLTYGTTATGRSFALRFSFPGDRQQQVLLTKQPEQVAGLVMHTAYTTVWSGKQPPDVELVRKLCGRTKKWGGFYLYRDQQDTWGLRFSAHFDATDLPETSAAGQAAVQKLRDLLEFVATVGDETAAELAQAK